MSILLTLLLFSFQNCRQDTNVDIKSNSSSTPTDPNTTSTGGNGSSTTTPTPTPTPTSTPVVVDPCPPSNMGAPVISDLYVAGTTTIATSTTANSGYTNLSGNLASNPGVEVALLATNVTPADVCSQSVTINCNISVAPGSTGVLWGTSERVALTNSDLECKAGVNNLDLDVPGKTPTARPSKTTITINPKNQNPDLNSLTHICMDGSATVSVSLRSTYNKTSATKTFTVNLVNTCPKEQKVNADTEAVAQGAFGEAVSLSGSRAAVLMTGYDAFGLLNVGGVRIYEKTNSVWQYITTVIPPSTELESDRKPASVLLNNNNLFVGNAAINGSSGRLWWFQRDAAGQWNKLITLDGAAGSKFGASLAFDGSQLFVGAPGGNGSVISYAINGSTLTQTTLINGTETNSDFGVSLAIAGSKLLIGAPGNAVNTTTTGNFHICDLTNLTTPVCSPWALSGGKLGTEIIPASSKLGSSVAIQGNYALIAAKSWYPATTSPIPAIRNGMVALIDLSDPSKVQVFKGAAEENFGSAIGFSTNSFFVGAKEALGKRGYVDQYSLTNAASRNYRYYGLDQALQDRFGAALAVSGSDLLVGAPLDLEMNFSTSGSATFFTIFNP